MAQQWDLNGKVILITGGATGIGAATARELKQRGAVPVLADLNTAAMEQTAAGLGPDTLTINLDVTDYDACSDAVARTVERHGGIDAVWANAGIASFAPLALSEPAAWRRTIEVNVVGSYNTLRAALPHVIERKGYAAITASLATFAHPPGFSAYATTKAGVEAMGNALRTEMYQHGVAVGTIHPTWIATPMVNEFDAGSRGFQRLRRAMLPPFSKTYPVEQAAADIAAGFATRSKRMCVPGFVRIAVVGRTLLGTRAANFTYERAAKDIEQLYRDQSANDQHASVSQRVAGQV